MGEGQGGDAAADQAKALRAKMFVGGIEDKKPGELAKADKERDGEWLESKRWDPPTAPGYFAGARQRELSETGPLTDYLTQFAEGWNKAGEAMRKLLAGVLEKKVGGDYPGTPAKDATAYEQEKAKREPGE